MSFINLYHKPECSSYHQHFIVGYYLHDYPIKHIEAITRHNTRGPAFISNERSNVCLWYLNDKIIYQTEEYCKRAKLTDEETFFFILTYGDYLPKKTSDLHPNHNPLLNMEVHYTFR